MMRTGTDRDGNTTSASGPPYELHGYFPVAIDESLLTEADCREALDEALRPDKSPEELGKWRQYLTTAELRAMEQELKRLKKRSAGYRRGPSPAIAEFEFEMSQKGRRRAYARRKFGGGRPAWYGDGLPPWQRDAK